MARGYSGGPPSEFHCAEKPSARRPIPPPVLCGVAEDTPTAPNAGCTSPAAAGRPDFMHGAGGAELPSLLVSGARRSSGHQAAQGCTSPAAAGRPDFMHGAGGAELPSLLVSGGRRPVFATRALLDRLGGGSKSHLWAHYLPAPLRKVSVAASLGQAGVFQHLGVVSSAEESASLAVSHGDAGSFPFSPTVTSVAASSTTHATGNLVVDISSLLPDAALEPCGDVSEPQCQASVGAATVSNVVGRVWVLSQDPKGCRAVQLALDLGQDCIRKAIAEEVVGHVRQAMRCPYANHVLQKLIAVAKPHDLQFIVDEVMQRGSILSQATRHRYGCRIIRRLLQHCQPQQVEQMSAALLAEAVAFACNPFGCFVMQHVVELGTSAQRSLLISTLMRSLSIVAGDVSGISVLTCAVKFSAYDEVLDLARAVLHQPDLLLRAARMRNGHTFVKAILESLSDADTKIAVTALLEQRCQLNSSCSGRLVLKDLDERLESAADPV